jgi:hypothetical protein
MNVCDPKNRIGYYAPQTGSGGGGGVTPTSWNIVSTETSTVNQTIKNINAVDVVANLVACDALTVAGVPITGGGSSSDVATKTQFMTATTTPSNKTSFSSTVEVPTLSITGQALEATNITTTNILAQGSTLTFGNATDKVINVNMTNKYVGINTASPSEMLHVLGNVRSYGLYAIPASTQTSTYTAIKAIAQSLASVNNEVRLVLGESETANRSAVISWNKQTTSTSGTNLLLNKISLYNFGTSSPRLDITGSAIDHQGASTFNSTVSVTGAATFASTITAPTLIQSAPQVLINTLTGGIFSLPTTETTLPFAENASSSGTPPMTYTSGTFTLTDTITRHVRIDYTVGFAASTTGMRQVKIQTSSTTGNIPLNAPCGVNRLTTGSSGETWVSGSAVIKLAPNGSFTIMAFQSSGSALNVLANSIVAVTLL